MTSLIKSETDSLRICTDEGLSSLQSTLNAIDRYHPSEGQFYRYCQSSILPHCQRMAGYFSDLKNRTDTILRHTDEKIEAMVRDLNHLKESAGKLEMEIRSLTTDIKKKEKDVLDANDRLEKAEKELNNARSNVSSQEKELKDAKEKRVVAGAGVVYAGAAAVAFTNPVTLGLLAGGALLFGASQKGVECREKCVTDANDVYDSSLRTRDRLVDDLKKSRKKLQRTKTESQKVRVKQCHIESSIKQLRHEQKEAAKSQEIVKNICRAVSDVESAAKILLLETDGGYTLEPLMTPMDELLRYLQILSQQSEFSEILSESLVSMLQNSVANIKRPAIQSESHQGESDDYI